MPQAAWILESTIARLTLPGLTARLDLSDPANGLQEMYVGGQALAGQSILGVELPTQLDAGAQFECHERALDLVATYPQTADRKVRVQAYWRALANDESHGLPGVDLQVSVQTSLWDTRPTLTAISQMPADAGDAGPRLARLRHELFGQVLEKGVILRARIRGQFVPRADDQKAGAAAFAMFLATALPLTT